MPELFIKMINELIKILLLKCALIPRTELSYSISDINIVFLQVPQIAGYYGLLQPNIPPNVQSHFEVNETCLNLRHKDNYKSRFYYQNFARSTIVVYHTGYYSERRLSKILNQTAPNFFNESLNVRIFYGKLRKGEERNLFELLDWE